MSNLSFRSVVNNSSWLLFDKLSRIGLGLIVSVWVARYLGPSQFGELAYVVSALIFFQALAKVGLDGILVRELSLNTADKDLILTTAFVIKLFAGFFSYLFSVSLFLIFESPNLTILMAFSGIYLFFQSFDVLELWFQSQSQNKKSVIAKLGAYIAVNLCRIWLIYTGKGINYFAIFIAVEMFMAAVALCYIFLVGNCKFVWRFSKNLAAKFLRESWPYLLSSLSIVLYMRIDQLMLKNLMDEKSLGFYAAGVAISAQLSFVPVILQKTLTPYITRMKEDSPANYKSIIKKIFLVFSVSGWLVCICFYLVSEPLIIFLYGKDFTASADVFSVHIFTNLFINLGIAQSIWMILEKKGKLALAKTLIGLLVCIAGNLYFIPRFGIVGAAYSAVLAQLFQAIIANAFLAPQIFLLQLKSLMLIKVK
ncbi:flippase [Pseudoalteromonas piscicida]|uniref:flippase n=1 Tax=Pseudoalteromonas piscicida TaxID=43662 RepID=UPI0030C908D7